MIFDARTPAHGVLVLHVPQPRVQGLTPAQANGRRRMENVYSVMGHKPQVQCIKTTGGGLPPSVVVAKGDARSSNHRRRSPKMRAQNHCFQGYIPTNFQYAARALKGKLRELSKIYHTITHSLFAIPSLEAKYERLRESFHRLHREHFKAVLAMEALVACAA